MSSEDYLIRYFRQLGNVLASILGYREKKMYSLAIDEIDQTLTTWFKIDPETLAETSDKLVKELLDNPSAGFETEKAIAELLYQKSVTFKEMGKNNEAALIAKTASTLFKSIDRLSGEFSVEIQYRIAELEKILIYPDVF